MEFLQRVLADPTEERRFQRRVAAVKWGLFAVLAMLLALVLHFGSAPTPPPASSSEESESSLSQGS